MSDQWEKLRAQYLAEPWGKLAQGAGFDPVNTESSARMAFMFCADRIEALEAALRAFIDAPKIITASDFKKIRDAGIAVLNERKSKP